jgi:hypothetical protein
MLKIEIDGWWEPNDFVEVLQSIESMYYKMTVLDSRGLRLSPFYFDDVYVPDRFYEGEATFEGRLDIVNRRLLERARYDAPTHYRLKVHRIVYASPGEIDLLGLGKALEVVANSIGRMVSYYDERHLRRERDAQAKLETAAKRIEVEKERENLRALQIKNARDALELFDKYPEGGETLIPLFVRDQEKLSSRIGERKLIAADILPSDGLGSD